MRVGQARKRDFNEAAIVQALEAIGIQVWRISAPGLPDLLVHDRARRMWLPIEIKRPRGKLTPLQAHLKQTADFPVVETVAQALELFGVRS